MEPEPIKTFHSDEAVNYNLTNAYVAHESGEFAKAKNFLERINPEEVPPESQVKFLALYGDLEIDLGHETRAIEFLSQALKLLEAMPQPSAIAMARILNSLGGAYSHQNNNARAVEYHQRCRSIIENEQLEDAILKLNVYFNLGREYFNLGENKRAEDYFLTAIEIGEKNEPMRQLAGIYWGLANIYKTQKNIEKAKNYYTRSSLLYERFNQLGDAVNVKGLLGGMLTTAGDFASAETILKSALALAEQLGDVKALYQVTGGLGYLYEQQQKLDEAETFIERGLELAKQSANNYLIGQSLANLAEIKLAKGAEAGGFELYRQAIEMMEQIDEVERSSRINFRFAEALVKAGKHIEAIEYYRKAYHFYNKQ